MVENARLEAVLVGVLAMALRTLGGAAQAADSTIDVPDPGRAVVMKATCTQVKGAIKIRFVDNAGSGSIEFVAECVDMPQLNHHWSTSSVPAECKPDAGIMLSLLRLPGTKRPWRRFYSIKPDIHFYFGEDHERIKKEWNTFPRASEHVFEAKFVNEDGRLEIWVDGRFYAALDGVRGLAKMKVSTSNGARVVSRVETGSGRAGRFLPLDISHTRSQGAMRVFTIAPQAGRRDVSGVPFNVVTPDKHIDVGQSKWLRQEQDSFSFYSPYYKRSTWDNVAESIILSVPKKHYNYAHVLCALSPEKGRSNEMTVRAARYRQIWDGGGGSQGDTDVVVDPAAGGRDSVKKVGSVQANVGGRRTRLPLYLVKIPLRTSALAGYLQATGFDGGEKADSLSLEFCRRLEVRASRNYGVFEKMPLGEQSGIHLFGVTLEEAPVEIHVTSKEHGNVLHKERTPQLLIEFNNPSGTLLRTNVTGNIRDYFGVSRSKTLGMRVGSGTSTVPFGVGDLDVGWYEADFLFEDHRGTEIWRQSVSFALLPPDTRQAGYESPYGTWWFVGAHHTEKRADQVLPLLEKLGFRHVNLSKGFDKKAREAGLSREILAKHRVTSSMFGYVRKGTVSDAAKGFLRDFPEASYAMIFHESGIKGIQNEIPPELLGKNFKKLTAENAESERKQYDFAIKYAKELRAVAPHLKIMLGNGGTPFNVHWLRLGFPKQYYDCIGMETAIQSFFPEAQPTPWNLQANWIAKRMREIYKYDIPIASCYEYDYRCTAPGALTLEQQAQWYVRDVLHCLAYEMPSINVALIMDCDSAYYTSRWGSSGLLYRAPLMMPKPSYVALATLTRVLDQAKYQRYLKTGSTGSYCLEFERGGKRVYALWTARGSRPLALRFAGRPRSCTLVDIMGRESRMSPGLTLEVPTTESVTYVVTDARVTSATCGEVSHPDMSLAQKRIVTKLDRAADWRVVPQGDASFETYCRYKPMAKGKITLAKGESGMRIALASQPSMPDIVARYAILRPRRGPIAVSGTPEALSLEIKGNAGWGRVIFEVRDAQGRTWSSNGWEEAPNSWDMGDWEADTYVNFDGWRTIAVDLPSFYPSGHYQKSFRNWRCHGDNSTKNRMAFPIKLSGLYVVMREKVVHVTDMMPANSMGIEVRDLSSGRVAAGE